jgi:CubicO group peptidase (beta-lactamase class C family)
MANGTKVFLVVASSTVAALGAQTPRDPSTAARVARIEISLLATSRSGADSGPPHTLAERMAATKVPGVGIAVFENGRIAWAKGYGFRDPGGRSPVDTGTLFQAASISKPVAVAAMLQMVEQGRFSLDEDVNLKLQSWKVPGNAHTTQQAVTLRRIASHTAGFTVHGFPGYAAGLPLPTLPQILDGARPANTEAVRVNATPGTRYSYSGGGITVMQLLMQDVSRVPFARLMDSLVLGPAGMRQSTYVQPLPSALEARAATAYREDGEPYAGRYHTYPEQAAAGLWTTPSDLARFLMEIGRAYRGERSALLTQKSARDMLTVVQQSYGLGMNVFGSADSLRYGHGGSNAGFRAVAVAWGAKGQGIVIMTNSDSGDRLIGEIIRAVAREYAWGRVWPG